MGSTHLDRDRNVFVLGIARNFERETIEMDKGWSRVWVVMKVLALCFALVLHLWGMYKLGAVDVCYCRIRTLGLCIYITVL
jgi:hypothetical protein